MAITVLTPMTFQRAVQALAGFDSAGRLYVHGHIYDNLGVQDPTQRALERYDPSSGVWTTLASSAQWVQTPGYIIDASDRIVYAGGAVFPGPDLAHPEYGGTNQGEIYDPAANTWAAIPAMPGSNAREQSYYWKDSGGLLRLGGGDSRLDYPPQGSGTLTYGNALWYSGGASGTWTVGTASGVTGSIYTRQSHAAALLDSSGRMFSIQRGGVISINQRYDPATDTYAAVAALPGGVLSNGDWCGVVTPADQIYIVGGSTRSPTASFSNHTWRYDIASDTWTTLANHPRNVVRGYAFYLGGQLYTIGCEADVAPVRTGIYQYDPVGDTWTASADTLSVVRIPTCIADALGGVYLIGGDTAASPFTSKVVEYWSPSGVVPPPPTTRRRFFAQMVG